MREISSKEFAQEIEDEIMFSVADTLHPVFNRLAERYGFEKVGYERFSDKLYDCHYGELRDYIIEWFEACGMDIRPDDEEW